MGSGRGRELSSVLNTTGQTRGSEVDRVLALTRFLHFNFYPATAGSALLPVNFKESLKKKTLWRAEALKGPKQ